MLAMLAGGCGRVGYDPAAVATTSQVTDAAPPGLAGLRLAGAATFTGDAVRLTADDVNQVGSAFIDHGYALEPASRLSVYVAFRITAQRAGADGLALVFATRGSRLALDTGAGLGHGLIRPAVAIDLDTHMNLGEVAANSVSVSVSAATSVPARRLSTAPAPFKLSDGAVHHLWVEHDGASAAVDVFVGQTDERPATPLLHDSVDLVKTLGNAAWIGVTASTGVLHEAHDLLGLDVDQRP